MSDPFANSKDFLWLIVTLPDDESSRKFQRASEDLEDLGGTIVQMIDWADYVPGEPPPVTRADGGAATPNAGPWHLVGFVHGPTRADVADGDKEAWETVWGMSVLAVLEEHGLKEDAGQIQ